MNILYYLDVFPKISESFILNEIDELEKRGHRVVICSLNEPDSNILHEEYSTLDAPVRYIETPSYRNITELVQYSILKSVVGKELFYPSSPKHHPANIIRAKRCIHFIENIGFDIDHVHTHFANESKFGAKHIATYYNVPFTITTHAYDIYRKPIGRYTKGLLNLSDKVITISEYNKRYLEKELGVKTEIDIVHAGIKPNKFTPSQSTRKNRIVTVGRFVEKKGLPYALEAISNVRKIIPNVEYHIIGSGKQGEILRKKAEKLDLANNINFLSNVSDERLIDELDQAQCFLLPCIIANSGDRDGIPVVLMEAMAMETPPVSTTISGIPELIDHEENGLLAEPKNPESLSDNIIKLLSDEGMWLKCSKNARKKILNDFNVSNEAESLEKSFISSSYR